MTGKITGQGRLAGKKAIVTGACGGIGTEIVRAFLRENASVIAVDTQSADTWSPAPGFDGNVAYRQVDISSESEIEEFFRSLSSGNETVDILVNNAGIILGKSIEQTTAADWERLMNINGRGAFLMMRGALPLMNKVSGSIVNVSSGAAVKPMKNLGAYGASKAAIVALSKSASLEFAPIRVNTVCPGVIDTPMPRNFLKDVTESERDKALNSLAAGRALGRIGLPAEVASVVLFLASDESAYVTGTDLVVDGGKL